jgi:putative sigma-54 modulation protein
MYASIDKAVDKITEQLRRYKSKMQNHHAKGLPVIDMNVNVLRRAADAELNEVNEDIEEENRRYLEKEYTPHTIVSQETLPLKILTCEEAIMKMELSGDAFLLFLHETDRKLKVIYRMDSGDYGIIEPGI